MKTLCPTSLVIPYKIQPVNGFFSVVALITVVEINQSEKLQWIITNAHPLHQKIISFFGDNAKRIYDVPIELRPEDVILN
jgi:hypothetical protein